MKQTLATIFQWLAYFGFGAVATVAATIGIVLIVKLYWNIILWSWNIV